MSLLKLAKPSMGGHVPLVVGHRRYGLPMGCRVVMAEANRLAWVLDPMGVVHAYTSRGTVTVPDSVQALVKTNFFGTTLP